MSVCNKNHVRCIILRRRRWDRSANTCRSESGETYSEGARREHARGNLNSFSPHRLQTPRAPALLLPFCLPRDATRQENRHNLLLLFWHVLIPKCYSPTNDICLPLLLHINPILRFKHRKVFLSSRNTPSAANLSIFSKRPVIALRRCERHANIHMNYRKTGWPVLKGNDLPC